MEYDAIIGCVVVVVALVVIIGLVLWSRRTVNLIDEKNLTSARHITHELKKNGRKD